MGKDLFAFYKECDIAEFFLVQQSNQIILIWSFSSDPMILEITVDLTNWLLGDGSQPPRQSQHFVANNILLNVRILWNLLV